MKALQVTINGKTYIPAPAHPRTIYKEGALVYYLDGDTIKRGKLSRNAYGAFGVVTHCIIERGTGNYTVPADLVMGPVRCHQVLINGIRYVLKPGEEK